MFFFVFLVRSVHVVDDDRHRFPFPFFLYKRSINNRTNDVRDIKRKLLDR